MAQGILEDEVGVGGVWEFAARGFGNLEFGVGALAHSGFRDSPASWSYTGIAEKRRRLSRPCPMSDLRVSENRGP